MFVRRIRQIAPWALALLLVGGGLGALQMALYPGPAGPSGPQRGLPTVRLTVAGHPVIAEVADTHRRRRIGLMGRDSLATGHGMLFAYPKADTLSFWMKNTRIPLTVAYIGPDRRIVGLRAMAPGRETVHRSPAPARWALEMRKGWFADREIEVGDRVRGLPIGSDR